MRLRMTALLLAAILVAPALCLAGPQEDVAAATNAWMAAYNSRDIAASTGAG